MHELPPGARALLDAARGADDPSPAARAQADAAARALLAHHGVGSLPALEQHTPVVRASSAGTLLKISGGALAVATLAIAGWYVSTREPPASPPKPAPVAPVAAAPAQPPRADAVAPAEPMRERERAVEAPRNTVPVREPRRASSAPSRARAEGDSAWLERELNVIASVDALIRRAEFDAALQLLTRSEPAMATHRLAEERSALAILARCGIGADPAALRERERFLSASPRSVLAARVRSACTASGRKAE